jgi:hypothetical protein
VINNYEELETADLKKLQTIFQEEYPKAEILYRKNKRIMFKIRELEVTNKIVIAREISLDNFNEYLKKWDRNEIRVK